ncbi:hypothetical protein L1887_26546 [Cichorium endivia]|nr:hypothetical protein L1887_26546 [Cichorium endivia]
MRKPLRYIYPRIDMRNEKLPMKLNEQEMLAFFKRHDVNNDKRLSWDELKQAFSDLGVSWVTWTSDRAMLKADDNEDGYISEEEMEKLIQFALKSKSINRRIFKFHDDMTWMAYALTFRERKSIVEMVHRQRQYKDVSHLDGRTEMTMTEFKKFMNTLDTNQDGCISRDELRQAVRNNGGWFATWKANRGMKSADANGNGFIDKEEIPNLAEFAQKEFNIRIVSY